MSSKIFYPKAAGVTKRQIFDLMKEAYEESEYPITELFLRKPSEITDKLAQSWADQVEAARGDFCDEVDFWDIRDEISLNIFAAIVLIGDK